MYNVFPIADIPGQRTTRVLTFDPNASVGCPRCHGLAQIVPHAFPGNTCPCGYIELAWMAYPSNTGNVEYVADLRAENARLRAGIEQLRQPHASDLEWECYDCGATGATGCPAWLEDYPAQFQFAAGARPDCTCGADAHNARIDALLKGDG